MISTLKTLALKVQPPIEPQVERYPLYEIPGAKAQLDHYWQTYEPASDGILCFDIDYFDIAEHMKTLNRPIHSVTDLGCAWGAQSLFFQDKHYIGVDVHPAMGFDEGTFDCKDIPFFREGEAGLTYHLARFPDSITEEMVGDCFLANMSIGYGNLNGVTEEMLQEGFSKFSCGYIRLDPKMTNHVLSVFPFSLVVKRGKYGWDNDLVFVSKTPI